MKTMQEKINETARNLVGTMLKKEPREWPPECSWLVYQPVRPAAETNTENKE